MTFVTVWCPGTFGLSGACSPNALSTPRRPGDRAEVRQVRFGVIRVKFVMSALGPIHPQQQTISEPVSTSHLGQTRIFYAGRFVASGLQCLTFTSPS